MIPLSCFPPSGLSSLPITLTGGRLPQLGKRTGSVQFAGPSWVPGPQGGRWTAPSSSTPCAIQATFRAIMGRRSNTGLRLLTLRRAFYFQHSPLTCDAAERPMLIASTCGVTSMPLKARVAR